MALINTGQIASLLRPGLKAVFGLYPTYPEQWTEIYKTYQSDKFQEIEVEMRFLGPADIIPQGSPVPNDTMGQRVTTNYIHKKVGLNFTITEETIQDNLYKESFPLQAMALRDSLRTTKNILGANILNQAFNVNYPIGDGQPLCSENHPIDGGTFSNTFPAGGAYVDFSEAGVEQALILIQSFPMQSGILANNMAKKLLVPKELQFAAERLTGSAFRTDTANNDISALYNRKYIPQGYAVNNYLLSPSAWFILTDADNGFKHFQRMPVQTDTYVDYPTNNLMAKAIERYSFGCSNSRAIFGSPGV